MTERINIDSGTPWEPIVGYSRAVRVGPFVFVSGTTATDAEGRIVGGSDAYLQTRQALENLERALIQAGVLMADVVRTRMFVTNITRAIGGRSARHTAEYFHAIRPATSMVEVSRLIDPEMLVEIEADALVADKLLSQ